MTLNIDATRLYNELTKLATFTHVEPSPAGTAVTRVVFTPDDLDARAWLRSLAEAEGFFGPGRRGWEHLLPHGGHRSQPARRRHRLARRRHPHAGMYDGTVGVIGGLEAMRALKKRASSRSEPSRPSSSPPRSRRASASDAWAAA